MEHHSVWLIRLVKLALLLTLTVIALGAYTRLSDAGLGCPDWPGCYGHFSVPQSAQALEKAGDLFPHLDVEPHKAWPEMIHRYFAATLGFVVFTITFLCLKFRMTSIVLPLLIAGVVVFQALLGMWTVTMKLLPLVVMGHLLGGFGLLCCLWLLLWQLQGSRYLYETMSATSSSLRFVVALSLIVVIGQIMLGGWTSSNYAALMCSSLPICEGDWTQYLDFKTAFTLIHHGHDSYEFGVLEYGPRLTIHISHRIGAVLVTLIVGAAALALWVNHLRSQAKMLFGALVVQIALGISNVVFNLPLSIAVLHNIGAALLLVSVLKCNYLLWGVQTQKVSIRRVSHE